MFFNWLVTAWHAIITRFDYDEGLQETLDNWAFLVFLIAYGLFLVVFVSLVLITVRILHTVNVVVIYVIYEVNIDNTCYQSFKELSLYSSDVHYFLSVCVTK